MWSQLEIIGFLCSLSLTYDLKDYVSNDNMASLYIF